MTLPHEPVFSSFAPNTTVGILELIIPPAHMGQGSSVTNIVQPLRRQSPTASQAMRIASISA